RSERVGRIHQDDVVGLVDVLHILDGVGDVELDLGVVELAGQLGQELPGDLDHLLVDLDHLHPLHFGVLDGLAHGAAVAAAHHQSRVGVAVDGHGDVDLHSLLDALPTYSCEYYTS